jgi:hypothetical protein
MYIDYKKFDEAELKTEPFECLMIEDFISHKVIDEIIKDLPSIKSTGSFPLASLKYDGSFSSLISELHGENFKSIVGKKFNMDISDYPYMIQHLACVKNTTGKFTWIPKARL